MGRPLSIEVVDGRKKCRRCDVWKDISSFNKRNNDAYEKFQSYCKECRKKWTAVYRRFKMMEFLVAYGGKCVCCGEKELDLLTVEHIRFKGHKLMYVNKEVLINRLKRLKWPDGYTVLCFNCNMSTKNHTEERPCVHNKKEHKKYVDEIESFISDNDRNKYFELKKKLEKREED